MKKFQKLQVSVTKLSVMSTVQQASLTDLTTKSLTSGRKQVFPSTILSQSLIRLSPKWRSGSAEVNHSNRRPVLPQTSSHKRFCLPSIRPCQELTGQTPIYHQTKKDKLWKMELTQWLCWEWHLWPSHPCCGIYSLQHSIFQSVSQRWTLNKKV